MRKTFLFLIVMAALVFGTIGGCKKTTDLASVDGKPVTQAEFDAYLKFKRVPLQDKTQRNRILDQYLEREALASAIEKTKVLDKDLLDAELNEFRKEMLIGRYFEKFLKDKVTDTAVRNYYNTHAADYQERKVHVAHVLIRTNAKMSETERKARLTTAQEAYSRIQAGKDFAAIAKDYSEDRISARKGGDLGWLKEGAIDPRFSKTAFSLAVGAVSQPFETPFGFHIIKVLEAPKTIQRPFEAVSGNIRYQLRAEAKKAELASLLKTAKVEKE